MSRDENGRFVKGHKHSKDTLDKIQNSLKGKVPWNVGNIKYSFTCINCNCEFKTHDKRRKYCSMQCSPKRKNIKIIKKCEQCNKKINVPRHLINRKKFCSLKCRANNQRTTPSEKHPNWKGGRVIQKGYAFVFFEKKYILEHRLIMEKHIKRKLKKSEIVHHINEDKLDNRIGNLKIMTRKAHIKHHKPHSKIIKT